MQIDNNNQNHFQQYFNFDNVLALHNVKVSETPFTEQMKGQISSINNKITQSGNSLILEMSMVQNGQVYTLSNKLEFINKSSIFNNSENAGETQKCSEQVLQLPKRQRSSQYSTPKKIESEILTVQPKIMVQEEQNMQSYGSQETQQENMNKFISYPVIDEEDQTTLSQEKQVSQNLDSELMVTQTPSLHQINDDKQSKKQKKRKSAMKKQVAKNADGAESDDDYFGTQYEDESSTPLSLTLTPVKTLSVEELKSYGIFTNRKNAVKNIVKAFHRYLTVKQNEEEILGNADICGVNRDERILKDIKKLMNRLERKRKYNQQLIFTIFNQEKLNYAFKQFLKFHAMKWLHESKISEQDVYEQLLRDYLNLFNQI